MHNTGYNKIFIFRFFAYLFILIGFSFLLFQIGPVAYSEIKYRKDKLFGVKYVLPPPVITSAGEASGSAQPDLSFGQIKESTEHIIKPASTEYGIVIEKIDANAKVIPNIDPGNESQYVRALAQGVAAAKGSSNPGEPGNLYIFSHSIDAPWNVARYNAVFYLLRELVPGDKVIIFYQNKRYDYIVYDKTIASPTDTSFLANRYDKPVLTLQTCDPPGLLINRLIVRARLQSS